MKKWLNWYLNDLHDGDYFFAIFAVIMGALFAFLGLMLLVVTKGLILVPLAIVGGLVAALHWADESR
jgi:hypothetical protein